MDSSKSMDGMDDSSLTLKVKNKNDIWGKGI